MAKKPQQAPKVAVTVTVRGEELALAAPTQEQWDRYLAKLLRGEDGPARRELIIGCAVSHSPEDAHKMVKRFPALGMKLANSLGEVAGEAVTVDVDDVAGTAVCEGVEFTATDDFHEAWESHGELIRKLGPGPAIRKLAGSMASDEAAAAALFARLPASISAVQVALSQLAGAELEVSVKKD